MESKRNGRTGDGVLVFKNLSYSMGISLAPLSIANRSRADSDKLPTAGTGSDVLKGAGIIYI